MIRRTCLAFVSVVVWATPTTAAEPNRPGLTGFELTRVDDRATGYATFQSHNQKVVSNAQGIFLTYIRTRNEAYTAQEFRLLRSRDGGKTFTTLYTATEPTNPPVLETDENAVVYLTRPDFVDGHAYLNRFAPPDYAPGARTRIPNGSAGKYAMIYDGPRQCLYFFAHNNTFHTVGLDGRVLRSVALLKEGPDAALQYPSLSLMREGVLHAAWTTQRHGKYLYWDIHHILSPDGGRSWQTLAGKPLVLPIVADQHGPADRVIRDDEYEVHTWLSSFLVRDGKAHLVYSAQGQPPRQHYLRVDLKSGRRDVDLQPAFRGERLELMGLDGLLASRAALADAPLYCVMDSRGRLACLASDDGGRTWYDYAAADMPMALYGVGGCRELTADGWIIGSCTDARVPPHVYFFRIRGGLSRAEFSAVNYADGTATLSFGQVRGQPEAIRLECGGAWGDWTGFRPKTTIRAPTRPTRIQLRSRLGIVSDPQPIPTRNEGPRSP